MKPPKPDALLIAQYMKKWPVVEGCDVESVFLYKVTDNHDHMYWLHYEGMCGIGRPGNHKTGRTVVELPESEYVKVCLVFEPDHDLDESDSLGRDIRKPEWLHAIEYLHWKEVWDK